MVFDDALALANCQCWVFYDAVFSDIKKHFIQMKLLVFPVVQQHYNAGN